MNESMYGRLDTAVDDEYDAFNEVLNETDGRSLYDFFDHDTMLHPATPVFCQRLSKYVDTSDDGDVRFGLEAGLHFAVTMSELAAHRTDKMFELLSDMLQSYEQQDYAQAQSSLHRAVDIFFEDNPTLDGFTEAYLLTDITDSYDEPSPQHNALRDASRLSAGLAFMALEAQATMDVDLDAELAHL